LLFSNLILHHIDESSSKDIEEEVDKIIYHVIKSQMAAVRILAIQKFEK
jgi:hypothetical protein